MVFNKKLDNVETSQLICDTDQLAYFKVSLSKV